MTVCRLLLDNEPDVRKVHNLVSQWGQTHYESIVSDGLRNYAGRTMWRCREEHVEILCGERYGLVFYASRERWCYRAAVVTAEGDVIPRPFAWTCGAVQSEEKLVENIDDVDVIAFLLHGWSVLVPEAP